METIHTFERYSMREPGADVLVRDPFGCTHHVRPNRAARVFRHGVGLLTGDASIAVVGDFLALLGDDEVYGDVVA